MKKFHKRAAVFLTAATLAGLPAGAFFYSSPGSLTVWADNVEVESSEESSPEDVDFSDGSEAEILADPVEQAQEDAGNDVTETPEVGITFTEPEGWQTDTATVKIQVEDTKNTGAFSIAKVEARLSENGGWSDITGNMEVSISSNCSVYVRVTDQNGNTYEQNRYIECFDKTKPTIIAAAKNGILIVQGVDAESGIAALYVNGNEFTELTNNTLNVRLQKADTSYEYFTLQAKDKAGNMSESYKVGNPYYENPDAVKENTEVSGTEQNAASLPADGTASKPTSATATVTEHQTTNETATAPTEPENTGNETDTEADTGRVQGESSASGMTTGTVQDKGGKEFYTIKTKSDKVFYLIVDKDKTDENVYLAQYESGQRTPKQETLIRIAEILEVNVRNFLSPGIATMDELMETLFWMDEENRGLFHLFLLNDSESETVGITMRDKKTMSYLQEWMEKKKKLGDGRITEEEYLEWKLHWPEDKRKTEYKTV